MVQFATANNLVFGSTKFARKKITQGYMGAPGWINLQPHRSRVRKPPTTVESVKCQNISRSQYRFRSLLGWLSDTLSNCPPPRQWVRRKHAASAQHGLSKGHYCPTGIQSRFRRVSTTRKQLWNYEREVERSKNKNNKLCKKHTPTTSWQHQIWLVRR